MRELVFSLSSIHLLRYGSSTALKNSWNDFFEIYIYLPCAVVKNGSLAGIVRKPLKLLVSLVVVINGSLMCTVALSKYRHNFWYMDYEIMMHEVCVMEKYSGSSRKLDLQKSLPEVLESGRLVLLNENANLGYRVKTLVEENKGLASESMFAKWKARELAKCVVKMREDRTVFLLHRKIENLQAQINGLEKRNKEYYEQFLVRDNKGQDDDDDKNDCLEKKGKNSDGIVSKIQLHMQRLSRRFKWKEDIAGKDCELMKRS